MSRARPKVVEAMLLAWLVATCCFVLPLLYPCSSVLEAVAGSADQGGMLNTTLIDGLRIINCVLRKQIPPEILVVAR